MRSRTKTVDGGRRWQRWTEDEAREALADFATSGESAAGYARRRGISTQRLSYWSKRLARPEATELEFVPVELAGSSSSRWLEIAAAGVVIRVREDLDVDQVARLVEAIGRRVGGAC